MKQNLITDIIQGMLPYLNNAQGKRLQEVLQSTFVNYEITENTGNMKESERDYVEIFLAAKRIEGCSEKSLRYYKATIEAMLATLDKNVEYIVTDDIREYLTQYQQKNDLSKVTIDNIRRILSSFFSWLEDEDYILKNPVRRIHKVKTGVNIKETYSDEALELMRDNCQELRDLAMIDMLASTGMRVGEMVLLNQNDIDFNERECIVLDSPTIVVITDRNDLDDQLYGQFAKCKEFLRQEPVHAESRENLKSLLAGRQANGIIFTTMQKFEESHEALSERNNIIVMADEAHRGQYGLTETVDAKTGKIKIGTARIIRNTLPNATYIGFTGTPISSKDRSTREVFGDYIDIYDMTQAVEDGATRPVYYESRVIKLNLDEDTLKLIDSEYDIMAENADGEVVEKSKRELGKMEVVLGNDNTINSLVCDILDHYENNRENLLTGKAMIVAYSRPIAMKIYKRILELRPAWTEKVGVVMTSGNNDPEEWRKIIGNKHHKDELAKKFKDNNSPMKIAIVVDMWLTGFDVPSLATMYVYKPMSGHNLMQAIARVNRVFRDKEGGLVVDYVGIASALKRAMNDYTSRDKKNYGDTDVAKVAYPKFLEKLSVCRDMFHGYDYSKFTGGTDLERAKTISGAVNFIMDREKVDDKDSFVKEALMLHQALSLCSSLVDEESRFEAAFFESVRVLVIRLTNTGVGKKISLPEMNARINELLKQSIKSDGVINLFSDIKEEFSLFDPKFLEEVASMKEKNLAVELLKKLIAEQVSVYRRTNVVKSEKFSEIMQRSLNAYLNGMLTNEEVIEEMLNLAKQIAAAKKEGDQLGLTADELAFYDALTKPQAIKDFYENEELIAITKELADTLRRNKTIDWQKRESARAKMRMLIKKLLKKHKYPPEGMEDAVQTVMTQCELWTDNNDMGEENVINFHRKSTSYAESNYAKPLMVAESEATYKVRK